jgi:hypothetical protein
MCEKCGDKKIRHKVCEVCGTYRGRQVIDVESRDARTQERQKTKLKEMGLPTKEESSADVSADTPKKTKKGTKELETLPDAPKKASKK